MPVASSFPNAPSTKASLGVTLRRLARIPFSCSNTVYCRIGFTTNTSAGRTPLKREDRPSSRMRNMKVPKVEGSFLCVRPEIGCSSDACLRAVMRVFTTHIGLVSSTVAVPAIAPANMDSRAVRFSLVRPDFKAVFRRRLRVHSYPITL